jgi:protein-S-isoprenylcysteine O-methyltransferase Ste14
LTLDHILRVVLAAVFVAVVPIGLYHRIKSQATRERLDRRREGLFILSTLRPAGAVFWIGVFAWLLNPQWMAWSSMPLAVWLRWIGAAVAGVAAALLVWTFRALGRDITDTVVTRKAHTLVRHGPYRWIRHPLYDSAALLTVSISLMAANWFLLAAGIGVIGLLVIRTRTEEAHLLARFGDAYRAYMASTGTIPAAPPARANAVSVKTCLLSLPERLLRSTLGPGAGLAREVGEVAPPGAAHQDGPQALRS